MPPRCLSSFASSFASSFLPASALSASSANSALTRFPCSSDFLLPTRHSQFATILNHSRTYVPAPLSPIIPALTQNTGVGGPFCRVSSPITLLFSSTMLTTLLYDIVGAPTFPFRHAPARLRRTCPTKEEATQEHRPFEAPLKERASRINRSACATSHGSRITGHGTRVTGHELLMTRATS